jgi:S-DNA-T family DNA segregation ATPase FtsK/SpoIIIE
MALIPGSSGWHRVHDFLLGVFGVSVFFVPIILIYTSVLIGMNKTQEDISGRAVWGVGLTFLSSAAIEVFFVGKLPGLGFFKNIPALFDEGVALKGGGVASYLIGGTLLKLLGGTGAKITTILLFFVLILLLTGKGIMVSCLELHTSKPVNIILYILLISYIIAPTKIHQISTNLQSCSS